jgi:hypothetical protein
MKCWKKQGIDQWRNIKDTRKFVDISPWNKSHIVTNEKGFNAEGLIKITRSKAKAQFSAKSYMKEHDDC